MLFLKIFSIILAVLYAIIMLYFCYKNGRIFKTLAVFAISGLVTLVIVNISSTFTGIGIPVNLWTVGSSSVFGLPGVLGLLILRMFF